MKFARTHAWKQYKKFRAAYNRHSEVATRALVEFNEINWRAKSQSLISAIEVLFRL